MSQESLLETTKMESNYNEMNFVRSENHLLTRFQHYRQTKKFTDVKIKVGSLEFDAHKMVLEGASSVIEEMLQHNENILEFQEEMVNSDILEVLLEFFYTSQIKITTENSLSLCLASHFLNICDLRSECDKFLSSQVSLKNIIDLYFISKKYGLENLKQSCARFIFAQNKKILQNDKLLYLNFEEVEDILQEMKVGHDKNETLREMMFKFVISWIEKDLQNRDSFLPCLFKLLPIHKLSLSFLLEHFFSNPLAKNSIPFSQIINETLNEIHSASNLEHFPNFSFSGDSL